MKIKNLHKYNQALLRLLGKDFPKERAHIIEHNDCWDKSVMSKKAVTHVIKNINFKNKTHMEMLGYISDADTIKEIIALPIFTEIIKRPRSCDEDDNPFVSFHGLDHNTEEFVAIFEHFGLNWDKFNTQEATSPKFPTIKEMKAHWNKNFYDKIDIKPIWRK